MEAYFFKTSNVYAQKQLINVSAKNKNTSKLKFADPIETNALETTMFTKVIFLLLRRHLQLLFKYNSILIRTELNLLYCFLWAGVLHSNVLIHN